MLCALLAAAVLERPALVDARRLAPEDQVLLATLQGQVNRMRPRLFGLFRDENVPWPSPLEKRLDVRFERMDLETALDRYRPEVAGQVLYDPEDGYSVSIATTLAGLERGVASARNLGLRTLFDARGRWPDKASAYDWALRNVLPRCDREALAYLDVKLPYFRDAIAQRRLFAVDLDPLNDPAEQALLDRVLDAFPTMSPVFGWAKASYADPNKDQNDVTVEHALVHKLSTRDLFLVPADFADNLTFFARLPAPKKLDQTRRRAPRDLAQARALVLVVISDGDNLQYNLNFMRKLWTDPDWPRVPLAWTVSPQWIELAPAVLDIYYREAAERGGLDEFVAGPSGYGYVNPGSLSPKALETFARKTGRACADADIRSVTVLDQGDRPWPVVERFIDAFAGVGLRGVWLAGMGAPAGTVRGAAHLGESVRLGASGGRVAERVNALAQERRFIFVYAHAWEASGKVLSDFADALAPDVRMVTASEMADAMRWAPALHSDAHGAR